MLAQPSARGTDRDSLLGASGAGLSPLLPKLRPRPHRTEADAPPAGRTGGPQAADENKTKARRFPCGATGVGTTPCGDATQRVETQPQGGEGQAAAAPRWAADKPKCTDAGGARAAFGVRLFA
jgi:hypothetical protein